MARTTTFETLFRIAAKWTGQAEVNKANRGIDSVERNAIQSSRHVQRAFGAMGSKIAGFGKIAGGVYAGVLGAAITGKIVRTGMAAVDAAMDVVAAQDTLGRALERNRKRYDMAGKSMDAAKQKLIDLAEKFEKTGFDAEDLEQGFAKLLDSMSPSQVAGFADEFSDIVAKIHGANASAEDMTDTATQMNLAILQGRPAILRRLNATKAEVKEFQKAKTVDERRLLLQKLANKLQGETQRVFNTTAGKVRQAKIQFGNLMETLGKPFADRAGEFAVIFSDLAVALAPLADKIAKRLVPAFSDFAKWLQENKTGIIEFVDGIFDTMARVPEVSKWAKGILDQIPVLFDLPKHWPAIKAFFVELWANTGKEFAELWPIISKFGKDLWANTLKEWEQLKKIVAWIDENIIKPIAALFDWLVQKISDTWAYITPRLEALALPTSAVGMGEAWKHRIPQAGDFTNTGGIPTTSYSTGSAVGGPDESQDRWTNRGYTSSGKNLTRGVVAVNPKIHPIGTVFRDKKTGEAFVAADKHGNVNPKVVDVYENPANYKASLGKGRDLQVVGRIPVPKTAAGIQEALKPFQNIKGPAAANTWPGGVKYKGEGITPGAGVKQLLKGINMRGRMEGASPTSLAMNSTININNATPAEGQAQGRAVARALQDPTRQLLAELRKAQNYEDRTRFG